MRAQASVEFIVVFSLAFIILIPILYMFHNYTINAHEQMATNMINVLGNDIISYAETTFYMGQPARLSMRGMMPTGVKDINITQDWSRDINELTFIMHNGQEIGFFSDVNINGTVDPEALSAGEKRIYLETMNTSERFVNITIK